MDRTVSLHFQELIFSNILSLRQNKYCADCKNQSPDWVSLNFGVFICYKCSGVHRSFGAQKTRVRSIRLDSWTLKQLYFMFYLNNEKANEYWEAQMAGKFIRPGASASPAELSEFIRSKYISQAFVDP